MSIITSTDPTVWVLLALTAGTGGSLLVIGSAADKVYTTQTGKVGSIGVVMMHVDQTAKNEKDGIKPLLS